MFKSNKANCVMQCGMYILLFFFNINNIKQKYSSRFNTIQYNIIYNNNDEYN